MVVILSVALLYYFLKKPPYLRAVDGGRRSGLRSVISNQKEKFDARRREAEDEALARLLDKISREGMDSLDDEERRQLEDISRKRRNRDNGL